MLLISPLHHSCLPSFFESDLNSMIIVKFTIFPLWNWKVYLFVPHTLKKEKINYETFKICHIYKIVLFFLFILLKNGQNYKKIVIFTISII